MSKVYFSKMNINDAIYDVYKGEADLMKLLQTIYAQINSTDKVYDDKGGRYKFFDLSKLDDGIIQGHFGYIKPGINSSYDPENDTAIDRLDTNKLEYMTFYFDVYNEMFAFTITQRLRETVILKQVARLINESAKVGVQFMLESNVTEFKKEIKVINVLKKIKVKLVPPNGDQKEFSDLFSVTSERLEEGNATNVTQEFSNLSSEGLNKDSIMVQKIIDGVGLGYAEVEFEGFDEHKVKKVVKSKVDAPFTKEVVAHNRKDKNNIAEIGRAGIISLSEAKFRIRDRK
jgi:hypothetical protein